MFGPLFSAEYAELERLIEQLGAAAVVNAISEICSRSNRYAQRSTEDATAGRQWARPVKRQWRRTRPDTRGRCPDRLLAFECEGGRP